MRTDRSFMKATSLGRWRGQRRFGSDRAKRPTLICDFVVNADQTGQRYGALKFVTQTSDTRRSTASLPALAQYGPSPRHTEVLQQ